MSWSEIADLMNQNFREDDMAFAESAYRKAYTSARKFYDAGIFNTDRENDFREKEALLKKERQKFFDQRREYNKILNTESRAEHLTEIIRSAANNLSSSIGVMYSQKETQKDYKQNDAVVVFSDWHYGLKTSNVFNEYDTDICKKRIEKTVEKIIERIELHQCNAAHVVILGDLWHGAIHVSARVASEEIVCEQIMHVSEILAQAIYEISKHVSKIYVHMTYGNHARTVQKKENSIHRDNIERIVPWWLTERFKDNETIVVEPEMNGLEGFVVINIYGHVFVATHGDLDSVSGSPRLFATLFNKKYDLDVEYILLGDKHHRESFTELGITSFLCGSLCGTDDYANEKRLFAEPSQILLIVNEDCGVDAEYRIKCE